MDREQYIKNLIEEKGMNMKSFAASINMPYTTLLSMLNGSIGGAAIDNVMKICKGLDITINELQYNSEDIKNEIFELSEHEKRLIAAYRNKPEMQTSINKLLDMECGADIVSDIVNTVKCADFINNSKNTTQK